MIFFSRLLVTDHQKIINYTLSKASTVKYCRIAETKPQHDFGACGELGSWGSIMFKHKWRKEGKS